MGVLGDLLTSCGGLYSFESFEVVAELSAEDSKLVEYLVDNKYLAFQCTSFSDALDWEASEISQLPGEAVAKINRPVFHHALLSEPIFQVRNAFLTEGSLFITEYFVTGVFRDRVESAGLTGFQFRPIEVV